MTKILNVHIFEFSYGKEKLLEDIKLTVNPGEHITVLGASGSGKSTLLHLIYGVLPLKEGAILYGKTKVPGPEDQLIPGAPFMKLVSQENDLMPYSTVSENLASNIPPSEYETINERISYLLNLVEMADFRNVKVQFLSGGQKQRVAIAKALAFEPEILLLDEAFSNLDSQMKNALRRKLFSHLKEKQISCITATHDSDEALGFSDRIAILKHGNIIATGSPEFIFNEAKTPYIAGFFGAFNYVSSEILGLTETKRKHIVYPHQLRISEIQTEKAIQVKIIKNYFQGMHYLVEADSDDGKLFFYHIKALEVGSERLLRYDAFL